jgi:hypothetical protein
VACGASCAILFFGPGTANRDSYRRAALWEMYRSPAGVHLPGGVCLGECLLEYAGIRRFDGSEHVDAHGGYAGDRCSERRAVIPSSPLVSPPITRRDQPTLRPRRCCVKPAGASPSSRRGRVQHPSSLRSQHMHCAIPLPASGHSRTEPDPRCARGMWSLGPRGSPRLCQPAGD